MTDTRGSRRTASPVRVTLNVELGSEIDGAWWPHTASLARELPELVATLHPVLGEIVDLKLNWTLATRPPALTPLSAGPMSMLGWNDRRVRLVLVTGRKGSAKLLVVPSTAKSALAHAVSRLSASLPVAAVDHDGVVLETANCLLAAARAESSRWNSRCLADGTETSAH
ncbi:hypothetical protein B1R94_04680 [Mycolicibacterium litorale]|nr:hypothetical protein B1R94_04680 [Mycolicibacterium litorale]